MIEHLFVYGSLAPGQANEQVLGDIAGSWQTGFVTGTLHQAGWGAALGYPGLVPGDDGQSIRGSLLSSDRLRDHWARLDAFEGEAYERVRVSVRLEDGRTVDASVYALKRTESSG
jgi:gamma-glutamylcyclotransferase (GGCT)/AIG2-like uncharacterized protein YtfP